MLSATGDGEPTRPSLLVWQDKLNASPGFHAISLMDYLRRIGYVFQLNVAQYNGLVAQMQDPSYALPILSMDNLRDHDQLLSEVERLLHNVLTALTTRIEHQRAFMRRHFGQDATLKSEYDDKVRADFGAYAPGVFLQDLRNYLTHYQLPVAQSKLTIVPNESMSVTFTLVRKSLQEWQGWRAGKAWLAAQHEDIDIVPIVDNYARIAGAFDKWLHDRIGQKYEAEIRAYNEEVELFNREHERVFGA